ncbi:hypothetical protein [Paraburkholderia bannensis]|uniref:hypothetical protein n=1 Tax=Paraburkholderia bannensis TaxID=765414 RepID=UPI002ABE5B9E|nr:hypothetical protein [Paraburkholderia bannensis]
MFTTIQIDAKSMAFIKTFHFLYEAVLIADLLCFMRAFGAALHCISAARAISCTFIYTLISSMDREVFFWRNAGSISTQFLFSKPYDARDRIFFHAARRHERICLRASLVSECKRRRALHCPQ